VVLHAGGGTGWGATPCACLACGCGVRVRVRRLAAQSAVMGAIPKAAVCLSGWLCCAFAFVLHRIATQNNTPPLNANHPSGHLPLAQHPGAALPPRLHLPVLGGVRHGEWLLFMVASVWLGSLTAAAEDPRDRTAAPRTMTRQPPEHTTESSPGFATNPATTPNKTDRPAIPLWSAPQQLTGLHGAVWTVA